MKKSAQVEARYTPSAKGLPSPTLAIRITRERPNAETLGAINRVIEDAIMQWPLPARVKRLAAPSYCYTGVDVEHLTFQVARTTDQRVVGVVALEPMTVRESPRAHHDLSLHGLYVAPDCQRLAVGTRLLDAALRETATAGAEGLLLKAQASAVGFFRDRGFCVLAKDDQMDYAHRLWKPVAAETERRRR